IGGTDIVVVAIDHRARADTVLATVPGGAGVAVIARGAVGDIDVLAAVDGVARIGRADVVVVAIDHRAPADTVLAAVAGRAGVAVIARGAVGDVALPAPGARPA